ncbi:hypothetical protein HD554DRAFT_2143127 [Boletus coccyginus]|nr:hypothetical protein HD554DRAFT_2143127 [Boletus coccyginus]
MRLSILPILLAGASAVSLAAAEPIRVIDNPSNANANIRFGHALANANVNGNDDNVDRVVRPTVIMIPPLEGKDKGLSRHFCGASLREKALRLSNAFRHALGMPPIEVDLAVPGPGEVHILPLGYPSHNVILHSQEEDEEGKPRNHHGDERPDHPDDDDGHEHHRHHGHRGHHGHHKHRKSFLRRIHRAIKALGPWEGRAVSFVLGCGIGVLLRMFWVLSVLAYRTVRGERGEETVDREYIVYEQVPETLFMAPPQYVDEKVKVEARFEDEERK